MRVRIARGVLLAAAALVGAQTFLAGVGVLIRGSLFELGQVLLFWVSTAVAAWIAAGIRRRKAVASFFAGVAAAFGAGWAIFVAFVFDAYGQFQGPWDAIPYHAAAGVLAIGMVAALIVGPWDRASRRDAGKRPPR